MNTQAIIRDANALKLHVGPDNAVWFSDGNMLSIASGMLVPEFLQRLSCERGRVIRILGCPQNAELICALYQHYRGAATMIELASPGICQRERDRIIPETALFQMRQAALAPSQGGWHAMTEKDLRSYALISRLRQDGRVSAGVRRLVLAHPAWKYLSFIRDVSANWVAWVLSFIGDPRWFIDPDHPNRSSKLRAYLGLMPRIQRAVSEHRVTTGKEVKCRAMTGIWKSGQEPYGGDLEAPNSFLWRIRAGAGGSVRGDLAASQKCAIFLRYTWLEELRVADGRPAAEPLFLPEMILTSEAERVALQRHLEQFRNSV